MHSRNKGKAGERELAHYLSDLFRLPVRRGQQYHGGADSPDVAGLPGLHVECKRVERLDLDAAMAQAEAEAGGGVPLVMHRRNRTGWRVTIKAEDLARFVDVCRALFDAGARRAAEPSTIEGP